MMIPETTFNTIVYVWIAIAVLVFPLLLKVTAPYGRHTKKNWGPMMSNRLGWFVMELPALAVFVFFIVKGGRFYNSLVLAALVLWLIHYVNRAFIFPWRLRTSSKKIPVIIVGMAIFFNLINGFLNGYWLGCLSSEYPHSWVRSARFVIGIILFIIGFFINQYHDHLLIKLRKNNGSTYKIPYGGLFRYISCPNYFGEIIQWAGFAILTWNIASFSFFLWTFVNLFPRAIDHHRWYKKQFPDYPESRKAIIPFLF